MVAFKKIYILIIATIIIIFAIVLTVVLNNNCFFVKSTVLENESLAGIYLMQLEDKTSLEKELGILSQEIAGDKGENSLLFYNEPNYADVYVDKNNHVIGINIEYLNQPCNTKFKTIRNIGSNSSFSDIQEAYGKNYLKKTWRNFMGSGDGYVITYIDKAHNTTLKFTFSDNDPYDNDRNDLYLSGIRLNKSRT